jgi:hypothetical protein
LERAVGSSPAADDWAARVSASLALSFVACEWPLRYLVDADG